MGLLLVTVLLVTGNSFQCNLTAFSKFTLTILWICLHGDVQYINKGKIYMSRTSIFKLKKYSKRLFLSYSVKTINYVLHLDKFNDEKIKKNYYQLLLTRKPDLSIHFFQILISIINNEFEMINHQLHKNRQHVGLLSYPLCWKYRNHIDHKANLEDGII